ncbi:MAG: DUF4783 domain-containing protein [Bacteroidetes bacterium]|jgi:hypothetical protein|nr:DUF4783 domain-containing protein [Bacteroidota bacterium]
MRKLIYLIAICLPFAAQPVQAQGTQEVFAQIERSIAGANASSLSAYFGSQVEVTINDQDNVYSKDQATFVIKEFFQDHPVRSFKILHTGSSNNTYYAVGEYYSTRGRYDTNVFIKKNGNSYLIEQIRFESEQ